MCGEYYSAGSFYIDKKYVIGYYPICKKCILEMVQQVPRSKRNRREQQPNETKESVKKVLQMMDLPYIDTLYENCIANVKEDVKSTHYESPFLSYIGQIKSLPQWRDKCWEDSEYFDDDTIYESEVNSNRKPRKEIYKIFGDGFSNSDYLFLQDQYDDWKQRVQINSKSQETYIIRICFKLLDIWKAQKQGKDTSKLDDSLNTLMGAANLQPKQNIDSNISDELTFGQLIEKWEKEKPISEPSDEFKDVDGIGKYIRVWFSGWLSKALGLNNKYTTEFENEVSKWTVTKPQALDEATSSVYDEIFGTGGNP